MVQNSDGGLYIVEWLNALNRKERYWLVRQAPGGFVLDDVFREKLSRAIDYEHRPEGSGGD